jgi:dTDP-4-dehydrorhamnose 3,5-epimerase
MSSIEVTNLNKFVDDRGWSLNDIYSMFPEGECQINFSFMDPNVIKAWHRHKNQDDYFCVVRGKAIVGTYNEDTEELTRTIAGEHCPKVIRIPAGTWHGLSSIGDEPVCLLYLVTKKYNPEEPDEERDHYKAFVPNDFWEPKFK